MGEGRGHTHTRVVASAGCLFRTEEGIEMDRGDGASAIVVRDLRASDYALIHYSILLYHAIPF